MAQQSSINSGNFTFLEDFDQKHTGYTNKYLEDRNNLKTYHLQKDHRMIEEPATDPNLIYTTLKDLEKTPVSRTFFSQKNLDYLQYMMKKIVYKESGHIIGRQSNEELLIIMRSIYLSDSKNLPYEISKQVAELNFKVLKYSVYDEILPKVKGYATFLNDNFRTNVVLPREKYASMSGSRINRGSADII
tara:strand:+ start:5674 stop:6240 length:567 start_codon:yes stop_codon:yes gene_type:complete